jgi:hypothetical protein
MIRLPRSASTFVCAGALASGAMFLGCLASLDKLQNGPFAMDAATPVVDAATLAPDAAVSGVDATADAAMLPMQDGSTSPEPDGTTPPVVGCKPLAGIPGVTALAGDARSLPLADGGAIWVVDQAVVNPPVADGGVPASYVQLAAAFTVGAGVSANCTSWPATFNGPAFGPSPMAPDGLLIAEDLVTASSGPALYYELFVSDPTGPIGLRALGFGIAPRDAVSGLFVPTSELLWSPDRPSYGASALRVGNLVYAYGCSSNGLSSDCFVSRADVTQFTSTAAYTYWAGDHWSSSPDDATSIVATGGTSVAVRPDPTGASRYVMTYVPQLGNTIVARTAVAPEGPWSAPTTLATCDLAGAGPGSFCSGAQQHPELGATAVAPLVLTVEAQTFATDAGADAAVFWPEVVTLGLP